MTLEIRRVNVAYGCGSPDPVPMRPASVGILALADANSADAHRGAVAVATSRRLRVREVGGETARVPHKCAICEVAPKVPCTRSWNRRDRCQRSCIAGVEQPSSHVEVAGDRDGLTQW